MLPFLVRSLSTRHESLRVCRAATCLRSSLRQIVASKGLQGLVVDITLVIVSTTSLVFTSVVFRMGKMPERKHESPILVDKVVSFEEALIVEVL